MDLSVERITLRGDDLVVEAARASFDRKASDFNIEQNVRLIHFLAKHNPPHWTPFGHVRVSITQTEGITHLEKILQWPTLAAGFEYRDTRAGRVYTHSIWGWGSLLNSHIFSTPDKQDIRLALARLAGEMPVTAEVLGLVLDRQPANEAKRFHAEWSDMDKTLRIRCPIVIARQLFKHTVGFVYSEASGRYIIYEGTHHPATKWSTTPAFKKQGAGPPVGKVRQLIAGATLTLSQTFSRAAYWFLRRVVGIAAEQARFTMPMSTSTTFVVTGSDEAWQRLITHRLDGAAQADIRVLAKLIKEALQND